MEDNLRNALTILYRLSGKNGRNLQMPGDPRYQPEKLKPYLGYDQWAGWLILVEWFWMKVLALIGVMPKEDAKLLTDELLIKMLFLITTTKQDAKEREPGINHDILALLALMRVFLPMRLHRWLHFCATSYDIINTAYALQLKVTFEHVFLPELYELDELWRYRIGENAEVLMAGRTHLQTALPVTAGFWLANLHNRYVNSARRLTVLSKEVPGKFSGAVGTSASQRALIKDRWGEKILMDFLELPVAEVSTQIAPPEGMARFYSELVLLSGALANLGEDTRILQSSQFGEVVSESSSSSAMSHKKSNPIAAENMAGMHVSVIAEFMKVAMTLVSDLQRDLRWSNVMRSYSAIAVYAFQQILTAKRVLKSMRIDAEKCRKNFDVQGKLVVAELVHLFLQREGVPDAHHLVNKEIIPIVEASNDGTFIDAVLDYSREHAEITTDMLRKMTDADIGIDSYLTLPENYLGNAISIAHREAGNKL
ncbi:MAG: lyase family protein [Parcubacteria group bacterium]